MRTIKNIVQILSTGYIFVYYSEHLFWARARPGDSLTDWFWTWLAYSLMAFVFLALTSYFRVKNVWALFLVGAAFGWIGEGVVVQTAYEMLPLSISFTGLAWHALITVWVGWYAVRKSLVASDSWSTFKLASTIGLLYGLWAISWWVEPDGGIASIPGFAGFSLSTTGLAILAYALAAWSSSEPFTPAPWAITVLSAILLLYFCFVTLPAAPTALLVLPILLSLVYWGLHQNRLGEAEGSLLYTFTGRASLWKYLSLFALPAAAILVYSLAMALNLRWYTNWILYLITTPLGFLTFGFSLYKFWRNKSLASEIKESSSIEARSMK